MYTPSYKHRRKQWNGEKLSLLAFGNWHEFGLARICNMAKGSHSETLFLRVSINLVSFCWRFVFTVYFWRFASVSIAFLIINGTFDTSREIWAEYMKSKSGFSGKTTNSVSFLVFRKTSQKNLTWWLKFKNDIKRSWNMGYSPEIFILYYWQYVHEEKNIKNQHLRTSYNNNSSQ